MFAALHPRRPLGSPVSCLPTRLVQQLSKARQSCRGLFHVRLCCAAPLRRSFLHNCLPTHLSFVTGCSSRLKRAIFHKLCPFSPLAANSNRCNFEGRHSGLRTITQTHPCINHQRRCAATSLYVLNFAVGRSVRTHSVLRPYGQCPVRHPTGRPNPDSPVNNSSVFYFSMHSELEGRMASCRSRRFSGSA